MLKCIYDFTPYIHIFIYLPSLGWSFQKLYLAVKISGKNYISLRTIVKPQGLDVKVESLIELVAIYTLHIIILLKNKHYIEYNLENNSKSLELDIQFYHYSVSTTGVRLDEGLTPLTHAGD